MSAGAFAARQRAAEGSYFNTEERLAVVRRLESMVESGKLDKSALDAVRRFESPVQIITTKEIPIFEYKRGLVPAPRPMKTFNLGTQFSLGRARWTTEDASIFSVADGKRLASTPPKAMSNYDSIRMNKIQRAAMETPTVAGYRLLPELTPGRAMLWGTVLAIWGTGALMASAMRGLDIQGSADASGKLRAAVLPWAEGLATKMEPLKAGLSLAVAAGTEARVETSTSQMVQRLKAKLMAT